MNPKTSPLLYWLARTMARIVCGLFWRLRVSGMENLPTEGPVLLATTHSSFLDPIVMGAVCPRTMRFLARNTLFGRGGKSGNTSIRGWFILRLGAVPIQRDGGGARATLRITQVLLEAGNAVLIFPEGTRSPDGSVQRFRRGVGIIARETGCPVVPISIDGSHRLWPRNRKLPRLFAKPVVIRAGTPVTYDETTSAENVAADLRDRVLGLRDDELARDGASDHEADGDSSSA